MKTQKWIWESTSYPNFTFNNDDISPLLREIAFEQGQLKAMMQFMDEQSKTNSLASTLENEVISSCEIEGEGLNRQSVRSSIKQRLGLASQEPFYGKRKEDNYVDILIDANTNYQEELTLEKLFGWHHAMFEKGYSGLTRINVAQFRQEGSMEH